MVSDENFEQVVRNASAVTEKIGIEHHILDLSQEFKKNVIDYFENAYQTGKTPNPCIMCNKTIKWGKIFDFAINELNADFIATGHYANIHEDNGIFKLYPAKDDKKDQLYYLFELDQNQLSKTMFPLNGFVKSDIRKIAQDNDLPSKSSKESQDICFIKKPLTTKKYLIDRFGKQKGTFVMKSTGEVIGKHDGFYQFTCGQRKGIGIAYSEPLYVADCDAQTNTVYLGTKDEIFEKTVTLRDVKTQYPRNEKEFNALVKIRYNMQAQKAYVKIHKNIAQIEFEQPVSAVTSGQAAVFYDINDGHLIGGGWISSI